MTPVLGVQGLELARGTREILRGVDLSVHGGELVALMGLSGSGKTTVLRAIAGIETFGGGHIEVDGPRARRLGAARRRPAPQGRGWCSSSTVCGIT
jgi:ABC-type Fe3+/spermidine/putrescine transport system ATPase subunit